MKGLGLGGQHSGAAKVSTERNSTQTVTDCTAVIATYRPGCKFEELRLGSGRVAHEQNIDVSSAIGAIWQFLRASRDVRWAAGVQIYGCTSASGNRKLDLQRMTIWQTVQCSK